MILLESTLSKEAVDKMNLVLVDENRQVITDIVYGTGLDTYDRCKFLYYDDFLAYRKERIKVHHFYEYDTLYGFAAGKYLVKCNFCKYEGKKIYLRYADRYTRDLRYHYIEIPGDKRIHLHEYNNHLREQNIEALKEELAGKVCSL